MLQLYLKVGFVLIGVLQLVEGIRPILPLIRNTPYGKRIQSKLQREQLESTNGHYGHYQQSAMGGSGYNPHNFGRSSGSSRNYGANRHHSNHHHHRLHHQSTLIDPYAYQNGRGVPQPIHGASYGGYTNAAAISAFDHGVGLSHSDVYSGSTYPYGM